MAHFLVSYDLKKTKDYPKLWEKLKALKAVRLLESFWVVSLATSKASKVRDVLKTVIDSDDAIAVLEMKPNADWAHTKNVYSLGSQWLHTNINQ